MTIEQLEGLIPVATQAPWILVAWLVYQLARRALADLCQTVPEAVGAIRQTADALERIAERGIRVDHHHPTNTDADADQGE